MSRFIWDTEKMRKIKVKEIREMVIREKLNGKKTVEAYGFFRSGVEILSSDSIEECRDFIDSLTDQKKKEKEQKEGEL